MIKNNVTHINPQQIVDILADNFAENSSDNHYKPNFLEHKLQTEDIGITIHEDDDSSS